VTQPELDDLGITEDLVTGEAVVLDLRPASFLSRSLALIIDYVVVLVAFFVVIWSLSVVMVVSDDAVIAAAGLVGVVAVLIGLPVTVETLTRGKSLGKLAMGLRVVRDDGGPIRMRQALIRALVGFGEIWLAQGSVAIIASLSNRRGKRLGDHLAGTYVVRERTPAAATTPPAMMPPRLAGWAAGCDLGRVPDRLAVATRQFLARAARLHPASRERLGVGLAQQLSAYVAPQPPPGTHPEEFLAAVLAERRERDLRRLRAEAEARAAREARRRAASPLSPLGDSLVGEDDQAPAR
jgi:uncharacterized RDD family membrane protein YckC